jgi:hypothetical protein
MTGQAFVRAKARHVEAQVSAAAMPIVAMITPPAGTPKGFDVWAVGPLWGPRSLVALPALDPGAPQEIHDRLIARVLADATGQCPACGGISGLAGPSPEGSPLAWQHNELTVAVRHNNGCPATFDEADARWFPTLNANSKEASNGSDA